MSLAAESLSFGYGTHAVGQGLDLTLREGEVLALLGPNGGGKTTLMRTLLGLLTPLGGRVTLDGRDLASMSVAARARVIGYVPQSHAATFAFTVFDMVLMGRTAHTGLMARPARGDEEVARAAIERMGIAHLAARPYTMVSGGERQMTLIARALAQEPRYVVFDEPTASLDFGNQGRVMREIAGLGARGLGIVFSTHDPNQAMRHADRVVMLRAGRVTGEGRVADMLTRGRLEELYGARVDVIEAAGAAPAFLPG